MKWKIGLRHFRTTRNLTEPQTDAIVAMLQEELNELKTAIESDDEHEIVDAAADLIVLATNHIEQMGYDIDLVMKQVTAEIKSRQQDPKQKAEWAVDGPSGKWQKHKSQDPSTLYKADFSTCKVRP